MKNIAIFGSTGSIGRSSLEVIAKYPEKFNVSYLTTNTNIDLLVEQALKFNPEAVVITDRSAFNDLISKHTLKCEILPVEGLLQIARSNNVDLIIAAMVGFAGLESTIEAVKNKKKIALANKETLVVAGHLITDLARKNNVDIIPVDSEHSAVFQCLVGEKPESLNRLILTASGGPFLNRSIENFKTISIAEALNHPNWKMGNKITIDSATMMNKGLEVIEAYWLFGIDREKIDVLVHPQSIIHSMVEFTDGSIKAQLGIPDMKLPIQYALSYPERLDFNFSPMDFSKYDTLTFQEPDLLKFRCLDLAYKSLESGGTYPVVLNAANEIAVEKFLTNQITFDVIPDIIEKALDKNKFNSDPDLNEIIECDRVTRDICKNFA
ncbi:MAG: 1-deoxy-D-xylulose-5-phosphate reductoisomerase [Bacteroidetes bacterium]|nr:1-deoxy-D-xylulose-5-phosphate reductoisomerase [Bacteroidota bacterium]MBU2586196.1 1-deoxy-D-xylulose-5-phosphate reductoisomerase [Bacteroidota bacterium]